MGLSLGKLILLAILIVVVARERNPRTGAFEPRRPPDRRDG